MVVAETLSGSEFHAYKWQQPERIVFRRLSGAWATPDLRDDGIFSIPSKNSWWQHCNLVLLFALGFAASGLSGDRRKR